MKVTVVGLWHLGSVTAACSALHFPVTGLDFDEANVANLRSGRPPVAEPGLADLLADRIGAGMLEFTTDVAKACEQADILWVCDDTPVDDDDVADVDWVLERVRRCLPHVRDGAVVLVSSQVPVGTCARLEHEVGGRDVTFACSPENLRLGKALDVFLHPERIVVGARDARTRTRLTELFAPFSRQLLWMTTESAEMTKHAVNAFLATSITFTNEIARLCELTGADAKEVEQGLKSEARIGRAAYVAPGGAIAGGTLARDLQFLISLGQGDAQRFSLLPACVESNERHRRWPLEALTEEIGALGGRSVAVLGLTYKPGTDTLRRSVAVELCRQLVAGGASVRAFDPAVSALPADVDGVVLAGSAEKAMEGADAVVVTTEWPEFRDLDWPSCVGSMERPVVIDANRFVLDRVAGAPGLRYRAVGMPR